MFGDCCRKTSCVWSFGSAIQSSWCNVDTILVLPSRKVKAILLIVLKGGRERKLPAGRKGALSRIVPNRVSVHTVSINFAWIWVGGGSYPFLFFMAESRNIQAHGIASFLEVSTCTPTGGGGQLFSWNWEQLIFDWIYAIDLLLYEYNLSFVLLYHNVLYSCPFLPWPCCGNVVVKL